MYRNKKISLVIPAYNEEKLIKSTLSNIPKLIDKVFVVDDCSPDNQNKLILAYSNRDPRIILLKHETNQGPGGAIITGYKQSLLDGFDITVVVGGDSQMNLSEVQRFLDPIVEGKADYVKGNRFIIKTLEDTLNKMPKIRLIGNWIISALTKIASGYYKTMDVVEGYTAISKLAIETINWEKAWKGYGYPMDFLIRMNAYGFKIADVPRTAIYLPGERQSQIKGFNYAVNVSPMLVRGFFWRLKFKYLYHDFHPLVLFYFLSFIFIPLGIGLALWLSIDSIFWGGLEVTPSRAILTSLFLISGFQFLLFAMLFDMQEGM